MFGDLARGDPRLFYSAVHPPSTRSDVPVISAAASDARNTIGPIRSSTIPRRPSLILESTQLRNSGLLRFLAVNSVSTKVGQTVFTRILLGPSSIAMAFVRPSTACLLAA